MYSSGYVDNYIDYEIRHVNNLQGIAFEKYICKLLENVGYKDVYRTQDSGDFGLDVIAYDNQGKKIGFQCKLYSSMVGYQAVEDVNAGIDFYGVSTGIVIINNYFTGHAIKGCKGINRNNPHKTIRLWDVSVLKRLMKRSFLNRGLSNNALLYQVFLNHINPENQNDLSNERKFVKSVIKHSQPVVLNNIKQYLYNVKLSLPYDKRIILDTFKPIRADNYIILIEFSNTSFKKRVNYNKKAFTLLNSIFGKISDHSKIIFIPEYKWIRIQNGESNNIEYPLPKSKCWNIHSPLIKNLFKSKYYLELIFKYLSNSNKLKDYNPVLHCSFNSALMEVNNELSNIEAKYM